MKRGLVDTELTPDVIAKQLESWKLNAELLDELSHDKRKSMTVRNRAYSGASCLLAAIHIVKELSQ